MNTEIICAAFIIFLWLLTTRDALIRLSGGKIRRIEMDDRDFAEKLEYWKDHQGDYAVVFKILTYLPVTVMAVYVYERISATYPDMTVVKATMATIGTMFVVSAISILIAEFSHGRLDILVLRLTMPIVNLLAHSLFIPLVLLVRAAAKGNRDLNDIESSNEATTAEDEILSLVEQDDEEGWAGSLDEDEKKMIRGIFDLNDTPVREIMTPRVDMTALKADSTVVDAKKIIIESGHSRIPVYEGSIDEIKGIIYAKDFLDDSKKDASLGTFIHKPTFIPETKNVGSLLEEFKQGNIHAAIIIDEYGGTSGIVTLEDILEEIVGEIRDEYDSEEEGESGIIELPEDTLVVDARYLIDDLNEEYELDLAEDEDVDTIGGLVCGEFGRIPEAGEELTLESGVVITVLKADKRKILTLKIKLPDDSEDR